MRVTTGKVVNGKIEFPGEDLALPLKTEKPSVFSRKRKPLFSSRLRKPTEET
jgi:hypothetical protein